MQHRKGFRTPPKPHFTDQHQNKFQDALTFHQQGELEVARRLYNEILRHEPGHFDCLHLSGLAAYQVKQFSEAERFFIAALGVNPNFAPLHSNYGNLLTELNRHEEALASFVRAIAIQPDDAELHNNCGVALHDLKRFEEALIRYDKAISLRQNYAEPFNNRGVTLHEMNRYQEAVANYQQSIAINPQFAQAYLNLGDTLKDVKLFDEALACYERSISIAPDYADAHFAKARLLLLQGDFHNGWREYEWRKLKKDPVAERSFPAPLWSGEENISGTTLLVHHEQGMGDVIQFCRYIRNLSQLGATVLFEPIKSLNKLTSTLDASFQIVDACEPALKFDYHIPLLSLPLALEQKLMVIPNAVPYLSAEEDRVARWSQRIGLHGYKVGICWQGGVTKIDAGRSFPLSHFEGLSKIPGVRLISLHKGDGEAQLGALPEGMIVETCGADFDVGPDAFLDTAAVMKCCDLVISSDTAVAHLAGALGVRTWVALKYVPDWRWFVERDDSPWYPSMRLFRQRSNGDWADVFDRIADALRETRELRS